MTLNTGFETKLSVKILKIVNFELLQKFNIKDAKFRVFMYQNFTMEHKKEEKLFVFEK